MRYFIFKNMGFLTPVFLVVVMMGFLALFWSCNQPCDADFEAFEVEEYTSATHEIYAPNGRKSKKKW